MCLIPLEIVRGKGDEQRRRVRRRLHRREWAVDVPDEGGFGVLPMQRGGHGQGPVQTRLIRGQGVLHQPVRDALQLGQHGATPGLGGMRGEGRADVELPEQRLSLAWVAAELAARLLVSHA